MEHSKKKNKNENTNNQPIKKLPPKNQSHLHKLNQYSISGLSPVI